MKALFNQIVVDRSEIPVVEKVRLDYCGAFKGRGLTLASDTKYRDPAFKDKSMTTLYNLFSNAFRAPYPATRATRDVRKSREEIIRAHAHGNIRLQFGHWYTQGDVDDWRERVRAHNF